MFLHADSEGSSLGAQVILFVLSCGSSNHTEAQFILEATL